MQSPKPVSSIGTHHVSTTLQEDLNASITITGVLRRQLSHHAHRGRVALDEPHNTTSIEQRTSARTLVGHRRAGAPTIYGMVRPGFSGVYNSVVQSTTRERPSMEIKTVGIDIGKTWFHLVGCNQAGRPVAKHKLNRGKLAQFIAKLPICLIAMEACPGSQHLARMFQRHGHDVRLIAPKFIKPYLKGQKNDFNDAAAIAEAVTRPTMRFVTIKSNEQLDVQAVHRIRDRLVAQRTAVINQIRAFLLEYGLPVKEGRPSLSSSLPSILEDGANGLSHRMRQLIAQLREHWANIDMQISEYTHEIELAARRSDDCQRLLTIPGIGPLGATALVAAVGNAGMFNKGRELSAWLGLVPRQRTTGGKPTLLGIGKQGNSYVRRLLIHGARSMLKNLHRKDHELGAWLNKLQERTHRNVAVVAVANKLARIAWAVLTRHDIYRSSAAVAPMR